MNTEMNHYIHSLRDGSASVEQYFDMTAATPAQENPQNTTEPPAAGEPDQVNFDDV